MRPRRRLAPTRKDQHVLGRFGTGDPKSKLCPEKQIDLTFYKPGTPGTPVSNPRVYVKDQSPINTVHVSTLKEFSEGVPGVPKTEGMNQTPEVVERLPYFAPDGTLVIPFDSPRRFHWWKGGQSVSETRKELIRNKDLLQSPRKNP